jgi:hypothetical protein
MELVLHAYNVLRALPPTRLEYQLNYSITLDPTVGSLSNI